MEETQGHESELPATTPHRPGLADLAPDAAHPFDQTNHLVEGLSGDFNDPDHENEREPKGLTTPLLGQGAPYLPRRRATNGSSADPDSGDLTPP
jgi:hypothetical protein